MSTIEGAILGFILALFLALAGIILWQHHAIKIGEARYEAVLKNASALRAENAAWKQMALRQNAQVAQLAAARKTQAARAAKADAAVAAQVRRLTDFAVRIRALKPAGGDCSGARRIEQFYLRERP